MTRAALVVAHPGHELRLHGWLEAVRPTVFVLTDGSGGTGRSRLGSTARLLAAAGARPGSLFGAWTDDALYAALMAGEHAPLLDAARHLAAALGDLGADLVVGDALEGYNPAHDLCRHLVDAAVALAGGPPSYDVSLVDRPDACPPHLAAGALRLELDDAAWARKRAAAEAYPELAGEVDAALRDVAPEAFRVELLRPALVVDPVPSGRLPGDDGPRYEAFGRDRVATGRFRRPLRFVDHVLPAARALRALAGRG